MRIGPYEVVNELGRGGMGVVYRARDSRCGREVALKTLLAQAVSADVLVRFKREGAVVAGFEHPHLVRVLDVHVEPPLPYVAFELVEGETLTARVLRAGPLPWEEAVQVVSQLTEAVSALHAGRVLHRDVKPENVLLGVGGAKLADFGLLKALDKESLTRTGATVGTPAYMAPEQVSAEHGAFSFATDVYGLAATLYFALTGSPPFAGATAVATLVSVLEEQPTSTRRRRRSVPAWLDEVCLRGMAKLPEERFEDPADFLSGLQEGAEAHVAPRERKAVGVGLLALLLGGLGAGAIVWQAQGPAAEVVGDPDPSPASEPPTPHVAQRSKVTGQAYPWTRDFLPFRAREAFDKAAESSDWKAAETVVREHSGLLEGGGEAARELIERLQAEAKIDATPELREQVEQLEALATLSVSKQTIRALVAGIKGLHAGERKGLSWVERDVLAQRALTIGVRRLKAFPSESFDEASGLELYRSLVAPLGHAPEPQLVWALVAEVYAFGHHYPSQDLDPLIRLAEAHPLPERHPRLDLAIPELATLYTRQDPPDLERASDLLRPHATRKGLSAQAKRATALGALLAGLPELALALVDGLRDDTEFSFAHRWHVCKIEAMAHLQLGDLNAWTEEVSVATPSDPQLGSLAKACGLLLQERWGEAEQQLTLISLRSVRRDKEVTKELKSGKLSAADQLAAFSRFSELRATIAELTTLLKAEDRSRLDVTRGDYK